MYPRRVLNSVNQQDDVSSVKLLGRQGEPLLANAMPPSVSISSSSVLGSDSVSESSSLEDASDDEDDASEDDPEDDDEAPSPGGLSSSSLRGRRPRAHAGQPQHTQRKHRSCKQIEEASTATEANTIGVALQWLAASGPFSPRRVVL